MSNRKATPHPSVAVLASRNDDVEEHVSPQKTMQLKLVRSPQASKKFVTKQCANGNSLFYTTLPFNLIVVWIAQGWALGHCGYVAPLKRFLYNNVEEAETLFDFFGINQVFPMKEKDGKARSIEYKKKMGLLGLCHIPWLSILHRKLVIVIMRLNM